MKIKKVIIFMFIIILVFSNNLYATDIAKNIKNEKENNVQTQDISNETTTNKNTNTIKSSNSNLKSLTISADGLEPKFDKNVTEYHLIVDLNVKKIDIKTTTEDTKSKVKVTGNTNLKEGENKITITVTAENGTSKKYIINVTRTNSVENVNANLKSLSIENYNIFPEFENNIYVYNLNISDKNISSLDIQAETENKDAKVEIFGNDNLKEGENIITVTVTAKDDKTQKIYKISAFMSSKDVIVKEEDKKPAYIILGVLAVAIIGISITLIKKK